MVERRCLVTRNTVLHRNANAMRQRRRCVYALTGSCRHAFIMPTGLSLLFRTSFTAGASVRVVGSGCAEASAGGGAAAAVRQLMRAYARSMLLRAAANGVPSRRNACP